MYSCLKSDSFGNLWGERRKCKTHAGRHILTAGHAGEGQRERKQHLHTFMAQRLTRTPYTFICNINKHVCVGRSEGYSLYLEVIENMLFYLLIENDPKARNMRFK